jgi:hypothetical protein
MLLVLSMLHINAQINVNNSHHNSFNNKVKTSKYMFG